MSKCSSLKSNTLCQEEYAIKLSFGREIIEKITNKSMRYYDCIKFMKKTRNKVTKNPVSSVADPDPVFLGHPDPDPEYRIRILYTQKDPCKSNFLVI